MVGPRPNLPVPGTSHMLWGTFIGGFQGFVALVGLGLAWRLGARRARPRHERVAARDRAAWRSFAV